MISNKQIDYGNPFDWGRTSDDYALFRDIYPDEFYTHIINHDICVNGQKVLDVGTGTGVLPRNLYKYGADFIGTDISANQISAAKRLSQKSEMNIQFYAVPTEELDFPHDSFDVITACQCFFYFNHKVVLPKLAKMLKSNGKLALLYMEWLPFEDKIAAESERLVLKYNPKWSGANETVHPIYTPEFIYDDFSLDFSEEFLLDVPFTRESWNGRIRSCRGIGASLSENEIDNWQKEHLEMLQKKAAKNFTIKHYAAIKIFSVKK